MRKDNFYDRDITKIEVPPVLPESIIIDDSLANKSVILSGLLAGGAYYRSKDDKQDLIKHINELYEFLSK